MFACCLFSALRINVKGVPKEMANYYFRLLFYFGENFSILICLLLQMSMGLIIVEI